MTLRGIDTAVAYLNAETEADPDMKDIATFLIFLKGLGKAEVAGGEVVYVYDIDLPKEGEATVNGMLLEEVLPD
jgi:hypothetical protein